MTKIYVDFRTGVQQAAPWDDNSFSNATAIGQVSADLLDATSASTGVSLAIATNPFTGAIGNGTAADAGSGEFLEGVLDYFNYFTMALPPDLVFSGLPASVPITFTACAWAGRTDRPTTFHIGGNSVAYDTSGGSAAAPPAPVTVSGNTDGSGNLTVNLTSSEGFGYIDGFILEYSTGPAGLTIDSTDASMQRGTNFEVVCSTPPTAPTTGNTTLINGNDTLTPSSVTGSDPYTLTFAVGDLTKQVDATGYDWTLEITP